MIGCFFLLVFACFVGRSEASDRQEDGAGAPAASVANHERSSVESGQRDASQRRDAARARTVPWVTEPGALFSDGVVCGVYSLAAAMSQYDVKLEIRDYLNAEYIRPQYGSSVMQLKSIAEQHGCRLVAIQNLDINGLCAAGVPALLNMRNGDFEDHLTGHWIAYLGTTEEGRHRVLDPFVVDSVREVSADTLNANWAGDALFVTQGDGASSRAWSTWSFFHSLLPIGLMVMVSLVIARFASPPAEARRGAGRFLCAAVLAIVGVAGLQAATGLSGPTDPATISWVTARHGNQVAPTIGFDEFCTRLAEKSCLIVDARSRLQFQELHLAGSQNLPAAGTLYEFVGWVQHHPPDTPIVVLCVGNSCEWDQVVANRLWHAGFRNVSVFDGGIAQCYHSDRFERQNHELIIRP